MLMTANPCADAERWADEQERRAAQAEALEIKAYDIVLTALGSKQASWFKEHKFGSALLVPDAVLLDAVGTDDETTDAFEALMTDSSPAAQALARALASYIAKHYWRDIVGSTADAF